MAFTTTKYDPATGKTSSYESDIAGGALPVTNETIAPAVPVPIIQPPAPDMTAPNALQLALTTQETAALNADQVAGKDVANLTGQTSAAAQRLATTGLNDSTGYNAATNQVNEYANQANTLTHQAEGIALQLRQTLEQQQESARGMGITAGGLAPHLRASQTTANQQLLSNSIMQWSNAASLYSAQGKQASAKMAVDTAISQQFDPLLAELATKQANLTALRSSPDYTEAMAKRAGNLQAQFDFQKAQIEKEKADKEATLNLAVKLAGYGVSAEITQKINKATSFEEAFKLAAPYMQDPAVKQALINAELDYKMKNIEIKYKQKQLDLLGEPTAAEKKELAKKIASATASLPVMYDKITTIDALNTSKGMATRVGTSIAGRMPLDAWGTLGKLGLFQWTGLVNDFQSKLNGDGQAFAGGIHNLTSGLTLQTLQEAKANGATFGALSDAELKLLSDSATKITDWELKDENGKPLGVWNIDEAHFIEEMNNIKRLTQRAIDRSQAGLVPEEDSDTIADALNTKVTSTAADFMPVNFY